MTPKTLFLLSELAQTELNDTQQAIMQLLLEEVQNIKIINTTEPEYV
jgi:hypothetical protein